MDHIRSHAVELARQSAITELSAVENAHVEMDEQIRHRKKEQILTKLKRLVPGTTTSLPAVQSPSGEIMTEPKEMAEVLCQHWRSTFSRTDINEEQLQGWLEAEFGSFENISLEELGLPDRHSHRWRVGHSRLHMGGVC